jgi:hypothetical protein
MARVSKRDDPMDVAVATAYGGMRIDTFAEAVANCIRDQNIPHLIAKVTVAKLVAEHREAKCESCGRHSMTYTEATLPDESRVDLSIATNVDNDALIALREVRRRLAIVFADGMISEAEFSARRLLWDSNWKEVVKAERDLGVGRIFQRVIVESTHNVEFLVCHEAATMLRTCEYYDEAKACERGKVVEI